jgi:YVTN family beta-propeller protein
VGPGARNVGFTRDGSTAFISVTDTNSVAVVDLGRLEVVGQVPVGTEPQGLIIR